MTNILVRDLPDEVHDKLVRKARASGQSLQQYLAEQLSRLADTPSMNDVLGRIAMHTGGRVGLDEAASDLTDERERR